VPTEPFATFGERFVQRVRRAALPPDVIYTSHVFYNSGFLFQDVAEAIAAARETAPDALFFLDGYHTFFAMPVDLSSVEDRVFYLAGGYKYAMAGEGVCFMHCPKGWTMRPVDTGWFATFGDLTKGVAPGTVPFPEDAMRMLGSTYDPVGLYRFNAVQDLWIQEGVTVSDIHAHARALQERFLDRVDLKKFGPDAQWMPKRDEVPDRGNFLTIRTRAAGSAYAKLRERGIVTDYRGDRLRFGFGIASPVDATP
jgi:selenocysteine lyase/cysteine desulfurase